MKYLLEISALTSIGFTLHKDTDLYPFLQPWLVRHSDGSAEFVNLCLDRCQVLPLKAAEAKCFDESPPEATKGSAKEACMPSMENGLPENAVQVRGSPPVISVQSC